LKAWVITQVFFRVQIICEDIMSRLILVFSALLIMFICLGAADSNADEGRHTLGVQAGQVGLSSDVGTVYGNALGVGAYFDYAASDWLELELSFISSKHSQNNLNLTQNDYAAYMVYNIDTFDAFTPYLKGGAEFVGHTQDIPNVNVLGGVSTNQSYTGFGLGFGIGGKFQIATHFSAGLDVLYHDIFTVSATPPGAISGSVNVIQNFYTVMLRLGFTFGNEK
jgi:opacity protein-like surface antigen